MNNRNQDFFWNFLIMIIVLAPVALILRVSSDHAPQAKPAPAHAAAKSAVLHREHLPSIYEEKNRIPDRQPMVDPSPAQTKMIMDKLLANLQKVRDLKYKVTIDQTHVTNSPAAGQKKSAPSFVDVYVRFDWSRNAAPARPGFSQPFPGQVRRDRFLKDAMVVTNGKQVHEDTVQHSILVDGVLHTGGIVLGESHWDQTPQEKIWGRWEAFDSILAFNYVSVPDAENPDHKTVWLLKSWFGTLSVDKKTFRPVTVVCLFPNGDQHLRQDFLAFHEFPKTGFYFPKTIKITGYNMADPTQADLESILRVSDLKLNRNTKPDWFTSPLPK